MEDIDPMVDNPNALKKEQIVLNFLGRVGHNPHGFKKEPIW